MQKLKHDSREFRDFGYQIIERLGSNYTGGRFAFKAIDLKNNQSVVIKQFRFATKNSGWGGYKALKREIETLQKIDHPQIPKYITNFDSGDGLCLVMEYIDGVPLSSQTFEPEEVYQIVIALLKILTYTHNLNIIHRDIKPENILINKENKIYLIDFGLASFIANNESMRASSVVAGTLGMMPPEQLLNKRVTQKSDLYSLGVTIFCLLMQQNTGWISSIVDSTFRVRVREYLDKKVDCSLINWLEKCVEPEPEKRFQSSKKALVELQQIDNVNYSVSILEKFGVVLVVNQGFKSIVMKSVIIALGILVLAGALYAGISEVRTSLPSGGASASFIRSVTPYFYGLVSIAIATQVICFQLNRLREKDCSGEIFKTAFCIIALLIIKFLVATGS